MQHFAMHYFQGCKGPLKSVSKILGVSYPSLLHLIDVVLHMILNISTLLNPEHMYPSPLTWIHRCATLWNAPFSKRQSIPELVMHQFWGWAVHCCYTDVRSATCAAQQFRTVQPYPVNTQICLLLQCTVFKDAEHGWKVYDTFNTTQHYLVKSC